MTTTVVVVNYNGGREVVDCVEALLRSTVPVDVVVVDNASSDGSDVDIARRFGSVTVLRAGRNLGFAGGANLGARRATTPWIVFVTTDALVAPDAVEIMVRSLESHPGAGAVGPLVRNPDGSVQPSKRAFPTLWQSALHGVLGLVWPGNPGTRAYTLADAPLDAACVVGWVSGATMAVRREAFEAVGGFDEAFFFFVEDVDLCKRLTDAGWQIWFEPAAEVVHAWGGTWTRRPVRFLWMHQRNLLRYATKHHTGAWTLAYPVIAAGLLLRFILLLIRWLVVGKSVPAHTGTAGDRGPERHGER
jgi:N-acetylglucosaminyl-diphospho-decaprenol L-rhamnosyltransferase